ncbi:hypothetical protein E2C01_039430 [Portunus trituberculatus]|uniref:Uncharacterized protein n=1 Tax=Portunus trituberculatus TaxID=210409 RepID=A0A5B7FKN6_PORTR|nr:hypothetical protein [Portunus trituberculatus]
MLCPPLVHGAGGSGNGTAQDTKVWPLLGTRAVTAVHVDPKLVYLLVEVVKHLGEQYMCKFVLYLVDAQ